MWYWSIEALKAPKFSGGRVAVAALSAAELQQFGIHAIVHAKWYWITTPSHNSRMLFQTEFSPR